MRGLVFALVSAGGMLLFLGIWNLAVQGVPPAPASRIAATPIPTPPTLSHVRGPIGWVAFELSTHQRIDRAYEMGDSRPAEGALTLGDVFVVPDGTPIQTLAQDGQYMRVEVLTGRYQGRRGWIKTRDIGP